MLYLRKVGGFFMEFEIKKKNGLKTIIAYLLIFEILSVLVALAVKFIYQSQNLDILEPENYNFASSLINLVVYLILFVAIMFLNHKELLTDVKEFGKEKNHIVLKVLAGYGIFYIINGSCSLLVSNIEYYGNFMHQVLHTGKEILTTAENQSAIEEIVHSNGFWMMALSAGIIGPICEEVVFRKAFFNICKTKEMGILLSSICFGLIHMTSSIGQFDTFSLILMTLPYVFSGFAFGLLYIKNDCNIMVPTIVHMLSNIISLFAIAFFM